jgi:hypothetical protein
LVWLKIIATVVVLTAVVVGYVFYSQWDAEKKAQQDELYARAAARVWVASAWFRSDPEGFIAYRDSLLSEDSLSARTMMDYFTLYQKHPEEYLQFTQLVSRYVDSLESPGVRAPLSEKTPVGDTVRHGM